jgi:hypothetical protein
MFIHRRTMKTSLTLACLLATLSSSTSAQYDTLWIGTPDGPSTSLANTPFPTGPGRTARTQYLVSSDALIQAGLIGSENVYGICLQVVDDDVTDPPCLVDLHLQMKNTVGPSLGDFEYTGLLLAANQPQVNLAAGLLGINFSTNWQWMGPGINCLVEVNYERSVDAGISPRILLDTGLTYTATFTARTDEALMGVNITSATNIDMETDNSLPVLGFLVDATTSISGHGHGSVLGLWPNPSSQAINVHLPASADQVRITDIMGNAVLEQAVTAGRKTLGIHDLATGCYVLHALSDGRVLASERFIKD